MATVTISYGSKTALTVTLASLASSSSFVAGRESTEVDNGTNKFVDAIVEGFITVGTTPTANTQIQVWVYASFHTSVATANIDVLDGLDSDETLTNTGVRNSALRLGAVLENSAATSNVKINIAPFSVAQLFGGNMPRFWGVFVTHNTGVALNATGSNHEIAFTGIKYDVV